MKCVIIAIMILMLSSCGRSIKSHQDKCIILNMIIMRQILLVIGLIFSVAVRAQQQITITCPNCEHAIKVSISVDGSTTAIHESTPAIATSGQCKAITTKGTQCSRQAQDGSEYCWQHAGKAGNHQATTTTKSIPSKSANSASGGRCRATTKSGSRCTRTAKSNGYCWQHGG